MTPKIADASMTPHVSTLRKVQCLGSAALVGALTASVAIAQDGLQGMMSAAPAGLLTSTNDRIQVRRPGASSGPVVTWSEGLFGQPGASRPSFDITSFPGGWNGIKFNSLSTGADIVPDVDSNGVLVMNNLWYAYSIALDASAIGAPGSKINYLKGRGVDLSRTVLTYFAQGSVGVSATYVDQVVVDYYPAQSGVAAPDRITGLDYGLGINTTNTSVTNSYISAGPTFPQRTPPVVYFTVTPAFVTAHPSLLVAHEYHAGVAVPVSAGDVYSSVWEFAAASGTYQWSTPKVAFSREDLGLPAHTVIDSISVYDRPDRQTLVFSTDRTAVPLGSNNFLNEILVYKRSRNNGTGSWVVSTQTPTQPLRVGPASNPVTMTSKFGLAEGTTLTGRDNPKAGCGWDPEATFDVNSLVAIPQHRIDFGALTDKELGISVARVPAPVPVLGGPVLPSTFSIEATGIQSNAGVTTLLAFYVASSGQPSPSGDYTLSPLYPLSLVVVPPGTESMATSLPIDPNFTGSTDRLHVVAFAAEVLNGALTFTQQSSFGVVRY